MLAAEFLLEACVRGGRKRAKERVGKEGGRKTVADNFQGGRKNAEFDTKGEMSV